jgi:hypothetical protein
MLAIQIYVAQADGRRTWFFSPTGSTVCRGPKITSLHKNMYTYTYISDIMEITITEYMIFP